MNVKMNKQRTLGLEQLETRELFAGNVTAYINGTSLQLYGDSNNNEVRVREIGYNAYRVEGYAVNSGPTKINGQDYQDFFNVSSDKVRVSLGAGNDKLFVKDCYMAGLNVDMGSGSDTVVLDYVTVYGSDNAAFFKLGEANEADTDTMTLFNVGISGNLHVQLGGGDDYIGFHHTRVDQYMSLWGEGGTDTWGWYEGSSYGKLWAWDGFERGYYQ